MIRTVKLEETALAEALYSKVVRHLIETGLDQWDLGYPGKNQIIEDIRTGQLYGYFSGPALEGLICVNQHQAAIYNTVNWDKVEGSVAVVHRLVADPAKQGKGIGKALMQFAESKAKELFCVAIRLDAYCKNERSNAFYIGQGYKAFEGVYLEGMKDLCTCYQKKL